MLLVTCGRSEADQATAAWMSTKVGWVEQSSSIGGPSLVTATVPVPVTIVLNSPPASMPAPCTRCTSTSRSASRASRLAPLIDSASPSSWTRKRSSASLAKNTSP